MFKDHLDDAWSQQQPQWSWWLVNRQEGLFIQFKPDTSTEHIDCVLLNTFRWSPVLGNPVRQQRMLRHLGIEMWVNLQKMGWIRCPPPQC